MAAWSEAAGELAGEEQVAEERYASGGELGRGGMGVVSAATDRWLDRDVAVKRPHRDLSAENLERMMREARITARLVHPGIVPVWDVGEDEDGPFYTMPVLVGRTLREALGSSQRTLREHIEALLSVCRAVGYAHRCGVVHRDLKPENVLLGELGEVWVLDWGVALELDAPDHARVGTQGYQAPEQLTGAAVGPPADVFSLGRVLQDVLETVSVPPPELAAVAARCTEERPEARYTDAVGLAEELSAWLVGQRVDAHAYTVSEVLWRAARRWRAPLAVGAVGLVVLAVTGAWSLRAQQVQYQRADAALATSLAWQAQQMLLDDRRAEAEVLASQSLLLRESPEARGVLMGWGASPRVRSVEALACEGGVVVSDGATICPGPDLRVVASDGTVLFEAQRERPSEEGWDGLYTDARLLGDGVVLQRSTNRLEVWSSPTRAELTDRTPGRLLLARGDASVVALGTSVGRLDVEHLAVAEVPTPCAGIQDVAARDETIAVVCRTPELHIWSGDAAVETRALPDTPSAVALGVGLVVGTYSGDLLFDGPTGWERVKSRVGAPVAITPLTGGRLAVLGERGRVAVWSEASRALLAVLPGNLGAPVAVGDGVALAGEQVWHFSLPPSLAPVRFDRSGEGGLSVFDVAADESLLVAGSASGEVVTWTAATGAAQVWVPRGDVVAKGVGFLSGDEVLSSTLDEGTRAIHLDSGESRLFAPNFAREVRRWSGGVAAVGWSSAVLLGQRDGAALLTPARPLATAGWDELWMTDTLGGVYRLEHSAMVRQFTLPAPSGDLAHLPGLVVSANGRTIEGRSERGELRWSTRVPASVTALDASGERIAVGDEHGGLHVLDATGAVLATVTGHDRLISRVHITRTAIYTASWDGTARRWQLDALDADPEAVATRVQQSWGLSLQDVLDGAPPLASSGARGR